MIAFAPSVSCPSASRAFSASRASSARTPGTSVAVRKSRMPRSILSTAATRKWAEPIARSATRKSKKASAAWRSLPSSMRVLIRSRWAFSAGSTERSMRWSTTIFGV